LALWYNQEMQIMTVLGLLLLIVGLSLSVLSFKYFQKRDKANGQLEEISEQILFGVGGSKFQLILLASFILIFTGLTLLDAWRYLN